MFLLRLIREGGPVMWIILICSNFLLPKDKIPLEYQLISLNPKLRIVFWPYPMDVRLGP